MSDVSEKIILISPGNGESMFCTIIDSMESKNTTITEVIESILPFELSAHTSNTEVSEMSPVITPINPELWRTSPPKVRSL